MCALSVCMLSLNSFLSFSCFFFFFFNDTATTEIYTLSLHDALPISGAGRSEPRHQCPAGVAELYRARRARRNRSEEHTSELQSLRHLVCRLLLEKKKKKKKKSSEKINIKVYTHSAREIE